MIFLIPIMVVWGVFLLPITFFEKNNFILKKVDVCFLVAFFQLLPIKFHPLLMGLTGGGIIFHGLVKKYFSNQLLRPLLVPFIPWLMLGFIAINLFFGDFFMLILDHK